MEIYAKMLSYFHVAKLCGWFDLSQFLNKGMVLKAVPQLKKETYENFIYSFKKCFT